MLELKCRKTEDGESISLYEVNRYIKNPARQTRVHRNNLYVEMNIVFRHSSIFDKKLPLCFLIISVQCNFPTNIREPFQGCLPMKRLTRNYILELQNKI